jgi:glucose-1-phosphate cytidylyltransferase
MYLFIFMRTDIVNFKKNLSVIILAGGKGQRLKPLTKNIPKPLIKLEGKSIIEHIIFFLTKSNLKNIIIAGGYKFKSFLNLKNNIGQNIKIINTGLNTTIINRIKKCLPLCNDYILICYGDTIANVKINSIIKKFFSSGLKTVISSYEMVSSFGVVKSDKSDVVYNFKEKPSLDIWYNIGYILFEKKIFLENKNLSFEKILSKLAKNKELVNHKHKGKHITVNTLTELEKAKIEIKNIKKK